MLRLAARILAVAYFLALTLGLSFRSIASTMIRSVPSSGWLATVVQGGHFVSMMILGILVTVARPPLSRTGLVALLLSYALLMEFLHLLLPARAFEWTDLIQNVSGVLIGMMIVQWLTSVTRRRRLPPAPDSALGLFARVHDTDHTR